MREFSAILRSYVVLRIAQSFFASEQQCLGVEVDSCMAGVVLEAQALAAAWPVGQSVAQSPETPQHRHRFLSIWCCLSCGVSLPSFPSFEVQLGVDVFFSSKELPLF